MRYRLMASYFGVPYHAGLGPDGHEATLFSPGPPPDKLGFTPAGGHWRKQVSITDLGALWQSRVVGEYRGGPGRSRQPPLRRAGRRAPLIGRRAPRTGWPPGMARLTPSPGRDRGRTRGRIPRATRGPIPEAILGSIPARTREPTRGP